MTHPTRTADRSARTLALAVVPGTAGAFVPLLATPAGRPFRHGAASGARVVEE